MVYALVLICHPRFCETKPKIATIPPYTARREDSGDICRFGVATIYLFEGETAESRHATLAVLRRTFELAGVDFIDENGGGPGVRLRKRSQKKR